MVTDVPGQKKDLKKTPVCETMVWPLTSWSKTTLKKNEKKPGPRDRDMVTAGRGQKPECRASSSIKLPLIDGRRTPGLELLPFQSPQI